MKNEVSIKYLGWIEDDNAWVSLTWSATLMTVDLWWQKVKILTDIGMFQWWTKDSEYNKKIDEEIIKADYVIITHAHADHIWKLPILVKAGFTWKIIMSPITRDIAPLMFEDYVKLTRKKIEKQEEMKTRRWEQLKNYFKRVKLEDELKNKNITKEEKTNKHNILNKLRWNTALLKYIEEAKLSLAKNNILKESDIAEAIWSSEIELLYDENDIAKTMSMIECLENYTEYDLDNRIVINSIDDEIVEKLPNMILNWYNKEIYVLPHLKNLIINKWKNTLDKIDKANKANKELREKLKKRLTVSQNTTNKKSLKDNDELELLKTYNISNKADIDKLQEQTEIFPFNRENITNFAKLLKPVFTKYNEKIVKTIKLIFINAGHIEWSVQVIIIVTTQKDVKQKVDKIIGINSNIETEEKIFWFSWDLWKITDPNISGSPDIPPYKFDYIQLESTYADRNHPDKKEEFKKLVKELNNTKAKNLVWAFANQRTQEIRFELLENKLEYKHLYPEFKALKKSLKEFKKRFEELEKIENDKLTDNEKEEKARFANFISSIDTRIAEIQETLFTWDIIMDSPLAYKISQVFLKHNYEKYKLLDPKVQEELFWRLIIHYLEKWEYKKLYKPERIRKKETIISSSGMYERWSIVNHLKNLIEDKSSKIVATGYQAKSTLWWEIFNEWKKQVIIEEKIYNVKAQIYQTRWYSAHIWQKDIIDYAWKLNYSKNAKLALVHWNEAREILAREIKKEMKKTKKKVEILIPKIWDEVKIKL